MAPFNMLEDMYDISKMVGSAEEVPPAWVYKTYYKIIAEENKKDDPNFKLDINQPFDGRIIKMKSLVNRDSTPSLCFYSKGDKYLWYDYSAQAGGDASYFVAYHADTSKATADELIMKEYEQWLKQGGDPDIYDGEIIVEKPEFIEQTTNFDGQDYTFWRSFKIYPESLRLHDVRRLSGYAIKRGEKITTFNGRYYGYYSKRYGLYQIYGPGQEKFKYLNVNTDYLIGEDQLDGRPEMCVIVSGLKDLMALKAVGLHIDVVAGRSESVLIGAERMDFLKRRYPNVVTMLDNDKTGIKAMYLYEKVYRIPYVRVDLEKDLADNNSTRSLDELARTYATLINRATQKWVNK